MWGWHVLIFISPGKQFFKEADSAGEHVAVQWAAGLPWLQLLSSVSWRVCG